MTRQFPNQIKFRWLFVLLAALTLTGCGLKGPLYMPPAEKAQTSVNSDMQQNTPETKTEAPVQTKAESEQPVR